MVGYDGTEAARRALDRAAELHDGEPITAISVLAVNVSTARGPADVDDEERRARVARVRPLGVVKG